MIPLTNGVKNYSLPYSEILFLEADHIYVKVHTKSYGPIIQRNSLKELLELLPKDKFLQTHRSYIVNLEMVTSWDNENRRCVKCKAAALS